ncbi:uncharacterized protein F4812DRAFT_416018 [Daldinia caldariorum]|uniref:uncharacterized protein n=1 Tax=Daldinia caldariorum TaxID=326644 RepID=UPI002008D0E1|nr:uncharacterized protein F4812DRAFT_416018 [Daldinia caldariorum]KAI1471919.1 hypothetical protein F4812DRAFT_416018 [Daldinia caldariorum]
MHRALSSRWLNTALNIAEHPRRVELPLFLCPSINPAYYSQRVGAVASASRVRPSRWRVQHRCLHMQADAPAEGAPLSEDGPQKIRPVQKLPSQCRGCGAFSQTTFPDQPGYFDLSRKAVQNYLNPQLVNRARREDQVYEEVLKNLDHEELKRKGVDVEALALSLVPPEAYQRPPPKVPLCDRCHGLLHNHNGESIYHPSIESIRDTILESPYKYNHVYHVLDAADFPMSLLPQLSQFLETMPLRTKNRRSRAGRFYGDQKMELSFVITRCDLLAPTKDQVDRLFPYLQEVLREALGRTGRNVRLGNLIALSAKRSWWTNDLKEEIWHRGGAGWMVGKANVGKSQLFEAVFPKGRMDSAPSGHQITVNMQTKTPKRKAETRPKVEEEDLEAQVIEDLDEEDFDEYSLLPPAIKETNYPEMPLVSDLPGTTASPIRIPFGNGRGELIDLPGLERTGLEKYVRDEHRLSLVMRSRIVPEQMTLTPGRSLLIGGFIRITPRDPAPVVLTYAFTPIEAHVTRTEKAIEIQSQTSELKVENIAVPGTGEKTKLAGSFELKWDVTKQRTGPLMRRDAINLSIDRLPYRVLSTDILIEGVGWVEVTAQVRTKDLFKKKTSDPLKEWDTTPIEEIQEKKEEEKEKKEEKKEEKRELSALERLEALVEDPKKKRRPPPPPPPSVEEQGEDVELNWPIVDVYSPEGKFISYRRPMNGWILNKPKVTKAQKRKRPRRSMKGMKKLEKKRKREREAAAAAAGGGGGGASF